MPNFVLAYGIRPPAGEAKKYKKELSSDAIALSGGFFYPAPRSTIVRRALSPFALLVIKGVLKALPSREWHGRPCRQSSPSPIRYVFYLSTRAIENLFQSPNRLPSASFGVFVYAVPDARGPHACAGAVAILHPVSAVYGKHTASNTEVDSCYQPLKIGLLS